MKWVKRIRVILAVLFLAATVAFFLTSGKLHNATQFSEKAQIVPSALAMGMGALLFWLGVTLIIGRVYCSTVCPLGTISDLSMRLRQLWDKKRGRRRDFRYKAGKRWRYHIMVLYVLCIVFGITAIPLVASVAYTLEPWNIMRDASAAIRPDDVAQTWGSLGIGVGAGIAIGMIMLIVVIVWGFIGGRDYCNTVCPIGSGLGLIEKYALYNIEIDPDRCISCMKCEEVCRSSCVKVVGRYVDNSRCVRCLDCITDCPTGAIRIQGNRNRPATPLMRKRAME